MPDSPSEDIALERRWISRWSARTLCDVQIPRVCLVLELPDDQVHRAGDLSRIRSARDVGVAIPGVVPG